MEDNSKLNDGVLDEVAGGRVDAKHHSNKRYVAHLQTGWLAMRTAPVYDPSNEIRGAQLYNGDVVYISGDTVTGSDGRRYVWVYSPNSGVYGYVNKAYLEK